MKKLLLILALMLTLPAIAQEWLQAGSGDGDSLYINKASVRKSGHEVQFDVKYQNENVVKTVKSPCVVNILSGFDIESPNSLNAVVDGQNVVIEKSSPLYNACNLACGI